MSHFYRCIILLCCVDVKLNCVSVAKQCLEAKHCFSLLEYIRFSYVDKFLSVDFRHMFYSLQFDLFVSIYTFINKIII